jgi:hypothetical protein
MATNAAVKNLFMMTLSAGLSLVRIRPKRAFGSLKSEVRTQWMISSAVWMAGFAET